MSARTIKAPPHKRGDSFSFAVVWTDDDEDRDFDGVTALAQVRGARDALLSTLTCNVEIAPGVVTVTASATPAQTALWLNATVLTDVQLTLGGEVWSTATIEIPVVADVTRAAP